MIAELTERVTLVTDTLVPVAVASLIRSGTTAIVTTATAHTFVTGDTVRHAGAAPADYNGEARITVDDATHYAFEVSGTPASPATGTITALFVTDASGGQRADFYDLAKIWAAIIPLSAGERLQAQAVGSTQSYVAKIYYRPDVTSRMKLRWTPHRATSAKTLEIHSVLPDKDRPREYLNLDVSELI